MSRIQAILYTRVSDKKQEESGLGLEAQLAACKRLAEQRGYEVIAVETDPAMTGKDEIGRRPGLLKVLSMASSEQNRNTPVSELPVVVVYALSRLSRRQSVIWQLVDERGAHRLQLVSATEPFDITTPMGRAMLGMLGVWAQLEADMIGERTSAALQARKARGHRLGMPPYAKKNPEAVAALRKLQAEGFSQRKLAEEANRRGIPTMRGGRWTQTQVIRTLRSADALRSSDSIASADALTSNQT
jgi:DNA invertase Pin-like site-specific DNA recombinase